MEPGGLGAVREAAPPFCKPPASLLLSAKIFVGLRPGFLKVSAFSPASFWRRQTSTKTKLPTKANACSPHRVCFYLLILKKANISSDVQYFRWPWQKKAPLFFRQGAFSFGGWRRLSETVGVSPGCPLAVPALPYGSAALLCPRRLGAGRERRPRVLTAVFPQDPPSRAGDRRPFVRPL